MKDSNLEKHIQGLKEYITNPQIGLPEEIFELVSSLTPMVNVDLLFRDESGRILLIWRDDPICGCGWHIPGGICRFQETRKERILKTAQKELQADITFNEEVLAVNEIILPQEVRGHFISFLYECYLPKGYTEIAICTDSQMCCEPGTMMWHYTSPKHWVKGQEEIYKKLFLG